MFALVVGAALAAVAGCAEGGDPVADGMPVGEVALPPPPPEAERRTDDPRPVLIAFGDSLTAGYGMETSEAWPSRLQEMLDAGGFRYRVVNAGVSGETSAGGLRRLPWVLDRQPRAEVVVIALGGNDGLRGVPPAAMAASLGGMVREAKEHGLRVLLAGVPSPPELGADYQETFDRVFRRVSEENRVPLLPSLLEGVAGVRELNQPDRIHPNVEGARLLAENVMAALEPLLGEPEASAVVP